MADEESLKRQGLWDYERDQPITRHLTASEAETFVKSLERSPRRVSAPSSSNQRNDATACTCGHAIEEHGHNLKYPGATACTADGCDCIAFEAAEDDSDG